MAYRATQRSVTVLWLCVLTVTRHQRDCCYDYTGTSEPKSPAEASDNSAATPNQPSPALVIGATHDTLSLDATIPLEVLRIIAATDRSIDDISTRYFNGLHRWVPFYCPDRFGKDLVQFEVAPTAEFSLLLLCMCLVTYSPSEHLPVPLAHDALYFHVKTLFAQIHVLRRPSTHSIQAGILLSIYEYAHGQVEKALASIDLCARMAYQIGMNKKPTRLGWSESWNTYWAIFIFERIFYCESPLKNIPLITTAPEETDFLPHEVGDCSREADMNPGFRVMPINRAGVGWLGRAAQATFLLDRVLQIVKGNHMVPSDQIATLIHIDGEVQRLLSVSMNKCHEEHNGHCGAVGTSIRYVNPSHLDQSTEASCNTFHTLQALKIIFDVSLPTCTNHQG